jgi:hypothetical protein
MHLDPAPRRSTILAARNNENVMPGDSQVHEPPAGGGVHAHEPGT